MDWAYACPSHTTRVASHLEVTCSSKSGLPFTLVSHKSAPFPSPKDSPTTQTSSIEISIEEGILQCEKELSYPSIKIKSSSPILNSNLPLETCSPLPVSHHFRNTVFFTQTSTNQYSQTLPHVHPGCTYTHADAHTDTHSQTSTHRYMLAREKERMGLC